MSGESVRRLATTSRPGRRVYQSLIFGRLCADRWALAVRHKIGPQTSTRQRGRILAYHSVGTPRWGVNDVSPAAFERHLQVAADDGWSFATPAEVLANPDKPQLALTFDDGLTSVLANALPVLRHHGVPATAFVVTGWADQAPEWCRTLVLDWQGVSALQDGGLSIASHSVSHPDFAGLSLAEMRLELEESRSRLRAVLGIETDEFAIPYGQSGNWTPSATRAAAEAGYTTVYAQCVATRPTGTVPRTFITRIDSPALFRAALSGAYDGWEEWY
jgi:peptidoglycan/xylan/chitin deacetylase (PgdA/CDA1 family)